MARPDIQAAPPPTATVMRRKTPSEPSNRTSSTASISSFFASMSAALEVGSLDLGPLEQLGAGSGERDRSIGHHVAAVRQLEGVEGVLLHQEHGELLARVEGADGVEDLAHDQGCKTERGLVEQEQPRPAHEGAGDRQHLLLAARQRAAALREPLLEAGEDGKQDVQ